MPIYEYQCTVCGHQLEAFEKVSDAPLTECPNCHKPALNKLISASGFQLKGTGWYATDYSKKSKPKETGESSNSTDTSGSTEKKPEETKTKNTSSDTSSSSNSGEASS